MAAARRKCFSDVVTVMSYDDSSDSSNSSSDEEDLDLVFVDVAFGEGLRKVICLVFLRLYKFQLPILVIRALFLLAWKVFIVMLRRLTYPNRWCDLVNIFGRSEAELSILFNMVINDIYTRFNHLLTSLDLAWLDPAIFADAIHRKGAPLNQCWGFIDGTTRRIARPIRNENVMYSGHKSIHCIKFQSILAPNGLIAHLFGPIEGRRHDAFMLGVSGLLLLFEMITKPDGEPYVFYGDPGYGTSRHIISPFKGAHLTEPQQQFNRGMSEARVSVEWGFGKVA